MSKQRIISIRRSDEMIVQAFEIALAQLGVFFTPRHNITPYITITGNKDDGVEVKTVNNEARVYLNGEGETFTYVDFIVFTVLNGVKLEQSKSVKVHNFDNLHVGNHLVSLMLDTEHRAAIIYQVIGVVFGFNTASSVLCYLWKYPRVETDEDEYKLIYEFEGAALCVKKIELWYSYTYGYTQAVINGTHYLTCELFTHVWGEHIATKPEPNTKLA